MGNSIQICYKIEDLDKSSPATLVSRPKMVVEDSNPLISQEGEKNNKSKIEENGDASNSNDEQKLVPITSIHKWRNISKRINL
mmetsp:Transcript_21530/g.43909  ORF Transcript_21530/g.43909 Transcript_21530/m.43909 type:complete len:83 (-) Transcript_21530:136-384(-)